MQRRQLNFYKYYQKNEQSQNVRYQLLQNKLKSLYCEMDCYSLQKRVETRVKRKQCKFRRRYIWLIFVLVFVNILLYMYSWELSWAIENTTGSF